MEFYKRINKQLKKEYGDEGIKPRFRLVWSNSETEYRKGAFTTFTTQAGLFLGGGYGTHERPKYTYIKDRWILEGLVFEPTSEIMDTEHGHYEPLWVFEKDGEYRQPEWKFVKYVVDRVIELRTQKKPRRTFQDDWNDDAAAYHKELADFEEQIDTSVLQSQFHHGEAIIMPSRVMPGTSLKRP